jgi:hypothetical protein
MGFAGRGNEKDRQLGMEWQNTEWGSLPLTVSAATVGRAVKFVVQLKYGKKPYF